MPLTQLNCPTTYPNDSTHPSSLFTTHNSIAHPYPLYNFFRNTLLHQLLSTDHHLPSTSPSITFTSSPFHVTDDPNEFQFFHFCQSTATTSPFFTPYTDQFSFTFAIFTATSQYFLLPNLISKNSLLAISCFSSFFIAHSACCTPYTFQFTFTFPFSPHNSLYFHLPNMVSKNSILAT